VDEEEKMAEVPPIILYESISVSQHLTKDDTRARRKRRRRYLCLISVNPVPNS
jgi:hypothetical protein